jgi:hypothetical protein
MRRVPGLFLAVALIGVAVVGTQPAYATLGSWSAPFWEGQSSDATLPTTPQEARDAPPTAVSIAVMPDGKIVYWDGLAGLAKCNAPLALDAGRCSKNAETRVLDLNGLFGTTWTTPGLNNTGGQGDLFCADQRLLKDGRVLAAGGTIWKNDPVDLTPYTDPGQPAAGGPAGTAELFGNDAARTFSGSGWTLHAAMNKGRWYPTATTLSDGRVLVTGGTPRLLYNAPVMPGGTGTNVVETEIFNPASSTWTLNGPTGNATLPQFAREHLMPDGKVLYVGDGQMWGPFGQGYDQAAWNFHAAYNPADNTWTQAGIGSFGARSGAFSVLLPLRASDGYQARILLGGGTLGTSPASYIATPLTEIVSYDTATGKTTSTIGPVLNNPRWYSSGVLLPSGDVLALNGADKDEVIAPGPEFAVHQAELFNGTSWTPLSSGTRDRTYHNSAILLADGRVLVGGHSPINYLYGDSANNSGHDGGFGANNWKDFSFEIFTPPYLETGASRPSIAGAGTVAALPATIGLNASLTIPTATDGNDVTSVALVRLPATSHTTDADMRMIELSITGRTATGVDVTTPPNSNVAPPGFYYLFLMKGGVPSKAAIVNIGGSLFGSATAPFGL